MKSRWLTQNYFSFSLTLSNNHIKAKVNHKMFGQLVARRFFSSSKVALNTLSFIEASGGKISPSTLSTLTAASQLGKEITALVAGSNSKSIADEVAGLSGVSKVLVCEDQRYDHYLSEELSPLVKELLETKAYTHFVTADSAVGKSLLPRLSALLDVQPISSVLKIESENVFVRPIYAGNALATVKSNSDLTLLSVRASVFPPVGDSGKAAAIEEYKPSIESTNRTQFVAQNLITSERPELGSAKRVVAGGRAFKNQETFDKLLEPLASKLNAAIGASRVAVDSGYCDNSLQIGQTGKVIAPELYLAVGISGAIQHIAGIKDAKVIAAVNKDPEAAIFSVADVGLVADINHALPELLEKL